MDATVEVRGGRVRGVRRSGAWSFSGIPYAGSVAGQQRWRPPTAPRGWTGVKECDQFGPIAPQMPGIIELSLGGEPEERNEDCLSLNIWTPALDGRRPVMVWVHGGSFTSGSGAGGLYRGGMLAREEDVVVVTLNYRLGILGFLAHPELDDGDQEWSDGETWSGFGNWGLADQIAALRWVRDHIADFGGDPANVTVFGESAGGMSVSALLATEAARGLFHRAIVQSGPPYVHSAERAAARAERFASHLGIPMSRKAWEEVPPAELVRTAAEVGRVNAGDPNEGLLLMPVVDDGLLSSHPEEKVARGAASGIPLLIGTTRDESAFFTVGNAALEKLEDPGLRRWVREFTSDDAGADELIEAVREARGERGEPVAPRDLWIAIATELVFRLPTIRFAAAHAATADPGVGTYGYLFTWESPAFGHSLGSCHAIDLPFTFGTVHNPAVQAFSGGGEDALSLSEIVRAGWTSFARSGQPSSDGLLRRDGTDHREATTDHREATWPRWHPDRRMTTVLGPWPAARGLRHVVERPRDLELEAAARAAAPRVDAPGAQVDGST